MNSWQILGLEPTKDIRAIKKAYAKMLALHHPEDDPEQFLRIKEAYDYALLHAKGMLAWEESDSGFDDCDIGDGDGHDSTDHDEGFIDDSSASDPEAHTAGNTDDSSNTENFDDSYLYDSDGPDDFDDNYLYDNDLDLNEEYYGPSFNRNNLYQNYDESSDSIFDSEFLSEEPGYEDSENYLGSLESEKLAHSALAEIIYTFKMPTDTVREKIDRIFALKKLVNSELFRLVKANVYFVELLTRALPDFNINTVQIAILRKAFGFSAKHRGNQNFPGELAHALISLEAQLKIISRKKRFRELFIAICAVMVFAGFLWIIVIPFFNPNIHRNQEGEREKSHIEENLPEERAQYEETLQQLLLSHGINADEMLVPIITVRLIWTEEELDAFIADDLERQSLIENYVLQSAAEVLYHQYKWTAKFEENTYFTENKINTSYVNYFIYMNNKDWRLPAIIVTQFRDTIPEENAYIPEFARNCLDDSADADTDEYIADAVVIVDDEEVSCDFCAGYVYMPYHVLIMSLNNTAKELVSVIGDDADKKAEYCASLIDDIVQYIDEKFGYAFTTHQTINFSDNTYNHVTVITFYTTDGSDQYLTFFLKIKAKE